MGQSTWSRSEEEHALTLTEDEFLAQYPHRSFNALRQRLEKVLLTDGETYGQFRIRQSAERFQHDVAAQRAPGMPDELPDDPDALERLFAAYREVVAASDALDAAPTKRLNWKPPGSQPIAIAWMSDIHAGGKIQYEQFERDLELIAETDGLFLCINGDLTENTKPQSKSGTALYAAVMGAPGLQLAYIATRLERVRSKLIVIAEGNHDGFDGRWAGIDRLPDLTKRLGCEYFTETGGSIFATIGGHTYHLVMRHNHRGNSQISKGNSARRLWDEWPWAFENADVIALAHTHEPHLEQVMRKGEIVTYLRSGTYKTSDEWAENQGWRSAYGVPITVLFPGERKIVAFHGSQFNDGVQYLKMVRER